MTRGQGGAGPHPTRPLAFTNAPSPRGVERALATTPLCTWGVRPGALGVTCRMLVTPARTRDFVVLKMGDRKL